MLESSDVRGLRHCLTFGLGLTRISSEGSFVGLATNALLRIGLHSTKVLQLRFVT